MKGLRSEIDANHSIGVQSYSGKTISREYMQMRMSVPNVQDAALAATESGTMRFDELKQQQPQQGRRGHGQAERQYLLVPGSYCEAHEPLSI